MSETKTFVALAVVGFVLIIAGIIGGVGSSSTENLRFVTPRMRTGATQLIERGNQSGDFLWNRLAEMVDTYGPRFSGNVQLERALDWIVVKAREDGLNVTEEEVMVPRWVRGNEWASMLVSTGSGPNDFNRTKRLSMVGLGMSNGTGGAEVTAEVLVVRDFVELDQRRLDIPGRIVLFNQEWTGYGATVQYRSQGPRRAAAHGAVACLIKSVAPYGIQSPHTGGSETTSIPAAALSIEDAQQIGRIVSRRHRVWITISMEAHLETDNSPSRNVIMTIPGTEKPNEFITIGGHIDSWDNGDGAMDDGGGALASWEAIRMIHNLGLRPRRTVRAVMFTNEENGNRGGIDFARRHAAELPFTSFAMESDSGAFAPFRIGSNVSARAEEILRQLGTLLAPIGAGGVEDNGGGGVDIGPMCVTGVPCAGLEVLDPRAFREVDPKNTDNNPCAGFSNWDGLPRHNTISDGYFWYHHTSGDAMEVVDPIQLQRVATAMAIWTFTIAELDDLLPRGPRGA